MPIKPTTTTEEGKKEKKTTTQNPQVSTEKVKIRIINVFLEPLLSRALSLTGSHSLPYLPRMPSNTVLISGPAVVAAQILIWSYFCVFLPPMSTAIRTSVFSFGELSMTSYVIDNSLPS